MSTTTGDQLSLLPQREPGHQASTTTLRLLTLNVQHANPARSRRQAEWLADQEDADILVLTEVGTGPGGDALTAALADNGYTTIIAPTPNSPSDHYRTVLASRTTHLEPCPTGITALPHRSPAAIARIGAHPVVILGLYVPSRGPKDRRNEDKRAVQAAVTAALPNLVDSFNGPVVVTGDLNIVEPDHVPHYPVFGAWEYDFYRAFAKSGLTDAYRALHPKTVDHSWFGRGGNGYRFDHAFITTRHRDKLLICDYRRAPRELGLSDHAAIRLLLAF